MNQEKEYRTLMLDFTVKFAGTEGPDLEAVRNLLKARPFFKEELTDICINILKRYIDFRKTSTRLEKIEWALRGFFDRMN